MGPNPSEAMQNSNQMDNKHSEVQSVNLPETCKEEKGFFPSCFLKPDALRVIKPLVPLKISLFLWYGAGSIVQAYQMIFLKHRGLTIEQLSYMNVLTPLLECFGPTISGWIADKVGKSKPVLLANLALVLIFLNCMMLIPQVIDPDLKRKSTTLDCNSNNSLYTTAPQNQLELENCELQCPSNFTGSPYQNISRRERYNWNANYSSNGTYFREVRIVNLKNLTLSWCDLAISGNCNVTCDWHEYPANSEDNGTFAFFLALFLLTLFHTTHSNCYRFMDVTAMSMVKTHNSDFGRERIWCVISTILLTPLSGYLVQNFPLEDGTENYLVAFYMFDVLIILQMFTVFLLDVQIGPPGEMMWKKTLKLLGNLDVLVFLCSVLVLGANRGYIKVFSTLYLDDLGATGMVYALLPTVGAIVGLPFLFTSNWWVDKIGINNFLILGFLAYVIKCVGYSFLVDPWISLVFEVLSIFTNHLLWVAVIRHSHEVAPEGLTATVIASAGGIHYGLGRGVGSLIGGLIMSKYGGQNAFRVIAVAALAAALLLAAFLYLRRQCRKKKECSADASVAVEMKKSIPSETSATGEPGTRPTS